MPSVSKKQQKFMGIVRSIQKGEQPAGKFSKAAQDAAKKMKKSSVKKYAKTKHDDLPIKKEGWFQDLSKKLQKKYIKKHGSAPNSDKKSKGKGNIDNPKFKKLVDDIKKLNDKINKSVKISAPESTITSLKAKRHDLIKKAEKIRNESVNEAKRDYKAEYKKFQSSTKAKKYRAELNKYNRQKGTYGNGDGKDASHKGGKIVGFESQSKNRGRAEKSRLKKEINDYVGGVLDEIVNEGNTVNELSLKKLEAAIIELKKKIKKQGRVTNARDEDHLERLMKVYNDMGGRKIKENSESLNWLYEKCWKGYEKKGMKKMFGKMYPNCVKKKKSESVDEGTCGYGIDGKIGEEPAGPNLMKKIKKISKDKEKKKILKSKKEGVNEAGMELKKLEDAIKMFQKKIKKQGRVTNARDEDHLENLIKIYKQMGGKKIKEAVKLKGKSGMGKISHLGVPQPSKGVEKLFKIADKGFDKVGGVTVDGMSASLFKQIYNKANDDIKNKLNKKSEKELVRIIGRMWDKFGKNVKIGSSL